MHGVPRTRSRASRSARILILCAVLAVPVVVAHAPAALYAQCPAEPTLAHFTGVGTVSCPCFVQGEEAGIVVDAPAGHYPIEILKVGIGWGSQFGGAPQSLEQEIRIYPAGLPSPGAPLATLPGPLLNDGFVNEFDLEAQLGAPEVASGPFTVTLQFLNQNAGDIFAPSVVHDGNGCQGGGKNVIKAIPGGWLDACVAGVTGDWVFYVIYRQKNCTLGTPDVHVAGLARPLLLVPSPNPFRGRTVVSFVLPESDHVDVSVFDTSGRRVGRLGEGTYGVGAHELAWDGRLDSGEQAPAGLYYIRLRTSTHQETRKVFLER